MKTVLKNGNVFYQNKIQKLDVEIDGETISRIGKELDGDNVIDCTDLLVTPGFVDLHVHLREPGFEHKGTIKQRSEVYETSQEWIQKEQLFHTMSMLGGFVIFLLLCAKRKGCISIKKHRTKESRGGKRW